MGWLITLVIIALIACVPLGVSARYDMDGALVQIIAGPVRLQVYPKNNKTKKTTMEDPKAKKSKTKAGSSPTGQKKGGSTSDFIPLLRVVLDFLGEFRQKLRVNRLELKVILAGDDPYDLAVNYGRVCGAMASLEPQLTRFFVIKKKDLNVECDFTADKTLILARVDLTITIGRFFSLGFRHGFHALREYLKIMKLRKGGATQ